MEARITALEKRVTTVEEHDKEQDVRIDAIAGTQNEIRESVVDVRTQISGIVAEWGTLHTTINMLIEVSRRREEQYNRVDDKFMRMESEIKDGQSQDRERLDELGEKVALANERIHDAEQRYIESYVPLRDAVVGSVVQRGLVQKVVELKDDVAITRKSIEPLTAFVSRQQRRYDALTTFAKSKPGLVMGGILIAGAVRLISLDADNIVKAFITFIGG